MDKFKCPLVQKCFMSSLIEIGPGILDKKYIFKIVFAFPMLLYLFG